VRSRAQTSPNHKHACRRQTVRGAQWRRGHWSAWDRKHRVPTVAATCGPVRESGVLGGAMRGGDQQTDRRWVNGRRWGVWAQGGVAFCHGDGHVMGEIPPRRPPTRRKRPTHPRSTLSPPSRLPTPSTRKKPDSHAAPRVSHSTLLACPACGRWRRAPPPPGCLP